MRSVLRLAGISLLGLCVVTGEATSVARIAAIPEYREDFLAAFGEGQAPMLLLAGAISLLAWSWLPTIAVAPPQSLRRIKMIRMNVSP